MEGAMMLLLFSAFLVVVLYKMDANEKKSTTDEKSAYEAGFREGMMWGEESLEAGQQRAEKFKSIMKRKK